MRDECPRNPKHAWIALERPFRKFRELAIIAAGKIVMDFANLFVHDMEIVDQPLCRRHDDLVIADGFGNGAVDHEQHATIVCEARSQWPAS